jgi:hypothetical protein
MGSTITGKPALVLSDHVDLAVIDAGLEVGLDPSQKRSAIEFSAVKGLCETLNRPVQRGTWHQRWKQRCGLLVDFLGQYDFGGVQSSNLLVHHDLVSLLVGFRNTKAQPETGQAFIVGWIVLLALKATVSASA